MDLGRTAVFADPAGAAVRGLAAGAAAGLGVVNAPGSWNWSNLHTRDLDGAARFYGAVFGWEAATIDFGGGMEATMLQLPGYGDALAERDPGIRERHEGAGAPPGLHRCGGVARAARAGRAAPLARDVLGGRHRAVVARAAAELGGEILQPPFDAGPVRMATLRDPQGAAFSVNTYAPGG